MDSATEPHDAQFAASDLIDAFTDHDKAELAKLTPEQRQQQRQARQTLYRYVDQIWQNAKAAGLNPALREDWKGVAGLRDLAEALQLRAWEAIVEYDEED